MHNKLSVLQAHPLLHMLGLRTSGSPARLSKLLGRFSCRVTSNRIITTSRGLREMKSLLCKALHRHWCQGMLISIDVRILSLVIQKEWDAFSRTHSSSL